MRICMILRLVISHIRTHHLTRKEALRLKVVRKERNKEQEEERVVLVLLILLPIIRMLLPLNKLLRRPILHPHSFRTMIHLEVVVVVHLMKVVKMMKRAMMSIRERLS